MGLFQKQPITNARTLFQVEAEKTLLIIGLGNPGKKYDATRHNIGFAVLDNFAKAQEFPGWSNKNSLSCELTLKQIDKTKVILAKPTTYMNHSGKTVSALQNFYKIENSKTLIVADELDINFGQIRTRVGGSSAGHNGLQSVIEACGEDFSRMRIGIGPKTHQQMDSADFVLQKFSKDQTQNLDKLYRETTSILTEYIYGGGKTHPETRSFII